MFLHLEQFEPRIVAASLAEQAFAASLRAAWPSHFGQVTITPPVLDARLSFAAHYRALDLAAGAPVALNPSDVSRYLKASKIHNPVGVGEAVYVGTAQDALAGILYGDAPSDLIFGQGRHSFGVGVVVDSYAVIDAVLPVPDAMPRKTAGKVL